jgi:hypothetical protein
VHGRYMGLDRGIRWLDLMEGCTLQRAIEAENDVTRLTSWTQGGKDVECRIKLESCCCLGPQTLQRNKQMWMCGLVCLHYNRVRRAPYRENFSMSSMLGDPYLSVKRSNRMSSFLPGNNLVAPKRARLLKGRVHAFCVQTQPILSSFLDIEF